jgi:hypothetical protein
MEAIRGEVEVKVVLLKAGEVRDASVFAHYAKSLP